MFCLTDDSVQGHGHPHSQPQGPPHQYGQFYQRPHYPGQPYPPGQFQRFPGHPFPRQEYHGQPFQGQRYPGPHQGIPPMADITNQPKEETAQTQDKPEILAPRNGENKENADAPKHNRPIKKRPKKIVAYPQPGVRVKIYRPEPILAAGGTAKAGNSPTTSLANNDIDLLHKMWAAQAQGTIIYIVACYLQSIIC